MIKNTILRYVLIHGKYINHTKKLFEEAMTLNLARKIGLYRLIHVLKIQNLAVKAFDVLIFSSKALTFMC